MDTDVLKTIGQIAGIGGLALAVFLLLFRDIIRKSVFSQYGKTHTDQLLRLISVPIFLIATLGSRARVWAGARSGSSV